MESNFVDGHYRKKESQYFLLGKFFIFLIKGFQNLRAVTNNKYKKFGILAIESINVIIYISTALYYSTIFPPKKFKFKFRKSAKIATFVTSELVLWVINLFPM
jgi:hypothetical protein